MVAELLVKGRRVRVDDSDFAHLSRLSWWISPQGYALTKLQTSEGRKTVPMHRIVTDAPAGMQVDHINREKLDNRRSNLRICTCSENSRNIPTRANKTSRHRGVSWNRRKGCWQVVLRINGRLKWCGSYESEQEAAKVAAPHFAGIAQ